MPEQVKPLSRQSEARIMSALSKVADLVEAGSSPTEAIYKVASEQTFDRQYIELLSRSYNIGATLAHLDTNDDLYEKAASIPLADPEQVISRLYPRLKSAAEVSAQIPSPEYTRPPSRDILWKQSQDCCGVVPRPTEPTPDPALLIHRGLNKVADARRELRTKQADVTTCQYEALSRLRELREYFSYDTALPFSEVQKNAEAVYGKQAMEIFKLVKENTQFPKRGETNSPVCWDQSPYREIVEIIQLGDRYKAAALSLRQASEVSDQADASLIPQYGSPYRFGASIFSDDELEKLSADEPSSLKKTEPPKPKPSNPFGFLTSSGQGINDRVRSAYDSFTQMGDDAHETKIQRAVKQLNSPEHAQRLNTIRAQSVLHELMLNDPIISEHPDHEVLHAFNTLSQSAPHMMIQPLAAKMLLRKHLEQAGNFDQFDLKQIAETDQKLPHPFEGSPKAEGAAVR